MLLFVVGLFLVNFVLHFPGQFNNDSVNQYRQAMTGQYADWHPPIMAWLWSLLLPLGEGAAPMLAVHLVLYWLGFGLLADGLRRAGRPNLAWAVAAAGAFPPFLYLNAVITKDAGMVAAWVAAIGLVFWHRAQRRKLPWLVVGAVAALVAYGTLVRANAIFALGPLLLYLLAAPTVRWQRLVLAAVLVAPIAYPVGNLLNTHVFKATAQQPLHSLIMFDLMGIAVHTGDPSLLEPRATLTRDELRACYTPYWFDPLSPWGKCASKVHRTHPDLIVRPEGIKRQWVATIAAHPVAYLQHRLKHFNSAVLFAVPPKHIRFTPEYQADDPSFKPLGHVSESQIRWDLVRKSPVTWPVTWMAWGVVLLAVLVRQRPTALTALAAALSVSALTYSCAYFLIGVHTDMRYHYWSLLALLSASLIVLPELVSAWRQRSRPLRLGLWAVGFVVAVGTAARLADLRVFV